MFAQDVTPEDQKPKGGEPRRSKENDRTYDPTDPRHPVNSSGSQEDREAFQEELALNRNPRVEEGLLKDHGEIGSEGEMKVVSDKSIGGQPVQTPENADTIKRVPADHAKRR